MVRLGRILRDYQDAGSVNGLLALWGFVDDTTFLTKAGHVGVVYRIRGVDYEGLSHPQRQALAHRFEAGLRLLDEHCRVYQYLLKRTVAPFVAGTCDQPIANEAIQRRAAYLNDRRHDLYDLSLYLVILYEAPHVVQRSTRLRGLWKGPREALRAWLSTDRTLKLIETELDRAVGTLHHKAQGFEVQISDFGPARLQKREAFRFFRELVNYEPAVVDAARLTHDTHLDYFVSDSAVDCHRDHLLVGDRVVKVLTTKEPPSQTFAFLMQDLYEIPGEFIACLEWQRIPSDRMRRDVQSRRRHFFNKRVSIVNYVAPETRPEEMLVDDSANTTVRQLGDALTELEVHGHFFGHCSLTLVLHGTDGRAIQHQTAEAMKAMAVHDGSLFEETYNLLNAWLAIVPGNGAHNLRRLALLETNVADLSFLFTLDHGDAVSPHSATGGARHFRDSPPDAVRVQPPRSGRRPHPRPWSDGKRQELSAELPDYARPEVRAADRRPRRRSQLPQAGDAARREISRSRSAAARRHDQPLCPRANARTPALPSCIRAGAARR